MNLLTLSLKFLKFFINLSKDIPFLVQLSSLNLLNGLFTIREDPSIFLRVSLFSIPSYYFSNSQNFYFYTYQI